MEERILARIAALEAERERVAHEAQMTIAQYSAAIGELKALLEPPRTSAAFDIGRGKQV